MTYRKSNVMKKVAQELGIPFINVDPCPAPVEVQLAFTNAILNVNVDEKRDVLLMQALVFKRELRRGCKLALTHKFMAWINEHREQIIEWNEGYDTDCFVLELPKLPRS